MSLKKIILEPLNSKSDTVGAFASGCVCCIAFLLHFFILLQLAHLAVAVILLVVAVDGLFVLGISFFAIQQATKSSTKNGLSKDFGYPG